MSATLYLGFELDILKKLELHVEKLLFRREEREEKEENKEMWKQRLRDLDDTGSALMHGF